MSRNTSSGGCWRSTSPGRERILGAVEVYFPYEPVAADIAADERTLRWTLVGGLLALWLGLFHLVVRASRSLSRQLTRNRHLSLHDPLAGVATALDPAQRILVSLREPVSGWGAHARGRCEHRGGHPPGELGRRAVAAADQVAGYLDTYDLPPSALVLEITESTAMVDPEMSGRGLGELDATGVTLSVDDDGTGHSSLACLSRLPVHELKTDRSFVMDMTGDDRSDAIVGSTSDLGGCSGLGVVAEGVERAEAYGPGRTRL